MVKFWSNKYNIPFHFREAPVELQHGANFQLRARVWRRTECLQTEAGLAASANNDSYICTAHIHEDHLETLMMSLLRGVHIANFHGVGKMFCFVSASQHLTLFCIPLRGRR